MTSSAFPHGNAFTTFTKHLSTNMKRTPNDSFPILSGTSPHFFLGFLGVFVPTLLREVVQVKRASRSAQLMALFSSGYLMNREDKRNGDVV